MSVCLSVCLSVIEVSHDAVKLSQTEADYVTLCADNDLQILPYNFKVILFTFIYFLRLTGTRWNCS